MGKRDDLKTFAPSLIERALKHVAPKTAQRLYQGRVQFEISASIGRGIGGYIGARRDRAATAEWTPGGGSANADQIPDLPMLRDRSRDQVRNAPVALGAINTDVLHVVGTGLTYTPAINAQLLGITEEAAQDWSRGTKHRFNAWAKCTDCDVRRQLDFFSNTDLSYRSWMESGDAFVLTPMVERRGSTQLALQLIEADRVCNPRGARDSDTLQDGIKLDGTTGEPIAVHVAKYHPGDFRGGSNEWTEIPIRGETTGRLNVLHLLDIVRPGQVRGVPWMAPVLEPLKQLNKWTDAELNAAVVSSVWAVFVEMDPDAFEDMFDDQTQERIVSDAMKWNGSVQQRSYNDTGKAINLLPGEKADIKTPGRPNPAFDPFFQSIVGQIGVALGQPKEVMMMYFQSSYTAARGALLMAWRRFSQRRDKIAKLFCQPVFELWLANEVAEGRIACPGFFADDVVRAAWCEAIWTGDGPGSVDPLKEVMAAAKRIEIEQSTAQAESIAYDGQDWEAKHRQRAKEVAAQRADGTLPPAATGGQQDPMDTQDNGSDDDTEAPPAAPAPGPAMPHVVPPYQQQRPAPAPKPKPQRQK